MKNLNSSLKVNLYFKVYVCLDKAKVYIHIPRHNWVQNIDLQEKQMTQGATKDIYMKLKQNMYHKTFPKWGIQVRMHESSKLDYTSTSSEYKWAFKHKHI